MLSQARVAKPLPSKGPSQNTLGKKNTFAHDLREKTEGRHESGEGGSGKGFEQNIYNALRRPGKGIM